MTDSDDIKASRRFLSDSGENVFLAECPGQHPMTLRDYFAGQAMAVMVDSSATSTRFIRYCCAQECYEIADAMLEERAK